MKNPPGKIKLLFLACLFSVFVSGLIHAQTADMLETLLDNPAINWSEAAVFVLEASDTAVFGSQTEAFTYAHDRKWLPQKIAQGDSARLSGIALLLMRSFEIKGGLFYRIGKSPHHAYRELVYKGVIRGDTDPDMIVSGEQLLMMVSRLLAAREAAEGGAN